MKDTKKQLIQDTLAFLKQEGIIPKNAPVSRKTLPPPKKIPKTLLKMTEPSFAPAKKGLEKTPVPKRESPLLLDSIRKHLPHIPLVETTPQMQTVAILFEDEEQLPLLTNLKNAIEERFCPCTILSKETRDIHSYYCLLTSQDRGHPRQILLAKASYYRDNLEEKRALWKQICQILSPKSS